ncbi:MAG TPA: SDR family NAD(P)-dependent oxidoreductase [Wenzhouxiangella sp.]|nr:SDR family NAD(P)-dependent oxidoreductase [Wenzhouxiangella sp.]
MSQSSPVTAVVGTGPGLGAALAARFAEGGHRLALLSRSAGSRDPVIENIRAGGGQASGFACDVTSEESVADAFGRVRDELGHPQVLIYNAGLFQLGGVLELSADAFENAWKVNCMGAFLAAREVLPAMVKNGAGSILLTGATAALRGGAGFAGLAVGKFGLRALSQSLAREFGPQGVHVAHVVIDGQIDSERTRRRDPSRPDDSYLDPSAIADTFWQLHSQPRSAWAQELDLRPHIEKF